MADGDRDYERAEEAAEEPSRSGRSHRRKDTSTPERDPGRQSVSQAAGNLATQRLLHSDAPAKGQEIGIIKTAEMDLRTPEGLHLFWSVVIRHLRLDVPRAAALDAARKVAGEFTVSEELVQKVEKRRTGGIFLFEVPPGFEASLESSLGKKPAAARVASPPGCVQILFPDYTTEERLAWAQVQIASAKEHQTTRFEPGKVYTNNLRFVHHPGNTELEVWLTPDGRLLQMSLRDCQLEGYVAGVWSARWIAVAYPWLIMKFGQGLSFFHPVLGVSLAKIGEEGLRDAARAGIPEAMGLIDWEEIADEEGTPDLPVVLGTVQACNLDNSALVELEHLRGKQAVEIGARGKLFTTETAKAEFASRGNWQALQQRFRIEVLSTTGPAYSRWVAEGQRAGLTLNDAQIAAASRVHNLPLVTADRDLALKAGRIGVRVRWYRPYVSRPAVPRRRPVTPRPPRIRPR